MAVKIAYVKPESLCGKRGITAGFVLLSVNGHAINDVLDYRFYADVKRLNIEFENLCGEPITLHLKSTGDIEDLGLDFETYLMDKQHSCKNKCIFCFVDQMPHGMRPSLYFKDDDSRLSFLFGNYVTLTNMTEADIDRLIEMHISPVNISVHTMNSVLRVEMMKNPRAGDVLKYLQRLADSGIDINAQLVLCPGYNDGAELDFSLNELYKLGKSIVSVAAVPVGLTKHRDGLCEINGFDKQSASRVIEQIDEFNKAHYNDIGRNFAFAADEFFLKAEIPVPECDYYDEFRQLDNGVGSWALTKQEFIESLTDCECNKNLNVALITGVAAAPLMKELSEMLMAKFSSISVDVKAITNNFFGNSVTVAGLVTASDIREQVSELKSYDYALIPSVMLKSETEQVFLDDVTLSELENDLNVKIIPVASDGRDLLYKIIGKGSCNI